MDLLSAYGETDEPRGGAPSAALCEVCRELPRIYKCPRCSIFSCGLQCCRAHKVTYGCSGVREKTTFVAINNFDDSTLRNDFHFLEDVLQAKVTSKRLLINTVNSGDGGGGVKRAKKGGGGKSASAAASGGCSPFDSASQQRLSGYPKHVQKLHDACKERSTCVLFVPTGMTKRSKNTSYYRVKEDLIEWRVNVVFVIGTAYDMINLFQADLDVSVPAGSDNNGAIRCGNSLLGISVDGVSERTTVRDLLDRIFAQNNLHRYALRHLKDNCADLRCFMQRIPSPQTSPTFYQLDPGSSLRDSLAARTVLEYPTVFVGTAANTARFCTFIQVVGGAVAAAEGAAAVVDAAENAVDANAIDIDEVGVEEDGGDSEEEEEDEEEQQAFFEELNRLQTADIAKLTEIIRCSEAPN